MQKNLSFLAVVFLALVIFAGATRLAQGQTEKAPHPAMARLDQHWRRTRIPKSRWLAVVLQHPFRTRLK